MANKWTDSEIEAMRVAFNVICDKADWKAPVDAIVALDDLAVTMNGIQFMTATPADCDPIGGGFYRVTAAGYRNGPCN